MSLDLTSSPTLDFPLGLETSPAPCRGSRLSLLGVQITDVTRQRALDLMAELVADRNGPGHSVYFVNAHTLNLAAADPAYRRVLNEADHVFGDGTGVRWAARLNGVHVHDNLVGSDLVPQFFRATADCGYRYFLLGGDGSIVHRRRGRHPDISRLAEGRLPPWIRA